MLKNALVVACLMLSIKSFAQQEPVLPYRVMVTDMIDYLCHETYPSLNPQLCIDNLNICVNQVMSQRIFTMDSDEQRTFNAVVACVTGHI